MQTVIDDILVNYEILGTRNSEVILMLHGWKRNLKDWKIIAEKLSANKKLVLVDLPGFGSSSAPKMGFDTYDYAKLINALIRKLKLYNITLVGHSFGGKVAVVVASKNDSIKKLILVDASGIDEKSFISSLKIILSKIIKPVTKFLPEKVGDFVFNSLASSDYKNAGNLKDSFKKIVRQDVEKEATKIKIPTLIIWGDKDNEVTTNSAKKFKSLIANSTLRIVWNAGHDPFLEKPDKFLEILREFL